MFCPNCGKQVSDDARFCPSCGGALSPAGPTPPAPGPVPPSPATGNAPAPYPSPTQPPTFAPEQGMKWFKFIIWVQLFLSALILLGQAFQFFTGSLYGDSARFVYALYDGLKTADVIMGIVSVAMAGTAIYVRMELAGFKRDAPMHYLVYLGAGVLAPLIYLVLASVISGIPIEQMMNASSLGSVVGGLIMIVVNKVYFDRRAQLFVN